MASGAPAALGRVWGGTRLSPWRQGPRPGCATTSGLPGPPHLQSEGMPLPSPNLHNSVTHPIRVSIINTKGKIKSNSASFYVSEPRLVSSRLYT